MPKKTAKSGLANKLGGEGRKAFNDHKTDDTDYGSGADLPAGIEGGVAQLVDCKFGKYKKGDNEGEYYFYAAGTVLEPKHYNGASIEGLHTQIGPEPICSTPSRKTRKTSGDHLAWVLNEMRKLGVDTEDIDYEDLESTAEILKDQQPFFRFRTWKGNATVEYPDPRVNHQWRGECEYNKEMTDEVVDETEEVEEEKEDASEIDNLEGLVTLADTGEEEASNKLNNMALEAGIDQDAINQAEDWSSVVDMIEGGGEEGEEETDWAPVKKEVCLYKPPRAKKAVECEVTAVFEKKKTCNVKLLDDGKFYKSVPWSKLEQQEE